MLDGILETLFWMAILGLGILVGLVAVMLGNDVKPEIVGVLVLAYLATVFGICFTLSRQISKLIDFKLRSWNADAEGRQRHLPPPSSPQLEDYREPLMSVTDHTTKTLDQIPLKRN